MRVNFAIRRDHKQHPARDNTDAKQAKHEREVDQQKHDPAIAPVLGLAFNAMQLRDHLNASSTARLDLANSDIDVLQAAVARFVAHTSISAGAHCKVKLKVLPRGEV